MPDPVIIERYDSRRFTLGDTPSAEFIYMVVGAANEDQAEALASAQSPPTYKTMGRLSITVEAIGNGVYECIARYGSPGFVSPAGVTLSFQTSTSPQRITQSLSTPLRVAAPGFVALDYRGAIGVDATGVQGVDILVPTYEFSEVHIQEESVVTEEYRRVLATVTGKINSFAFRGFPPGEVLFLGASGSKPNVGDGSPWVITYRFARSEQLVNATIGGISGIDKLGWDYVWFRYEDQIDVDNGRIIQRPVAAYVERVYRDANFADLLI